MKGILCIAKVSRLVYLAKQFINCRCFKKMKKISNEELKERLDKIEKKLDYLTKTLEKHIGFIDNTYEVLKNPIEGVKRFLKK